MTVRAFTLATLIAAGLPLAAAALPPAPAPAPAAAPSADPLGAHAAIAQAEERLAEVDATITVLQADADTVGAAARQRAHDAVEALRAIREIYRKEIDAVAAQGRQMTVEQLTMAKAALAAPWTQFEQALDRDVAAVKLDAEQRKALVEARIKAEQAYWQKVITDLQASAASLTAEQRAAIDARIAAVKVRALDAQTRLGRLAHASRGAWSALKQGFINSRQIFDDAYRSPR